ncbi:hypothetical protein T459_21799 [Capsicum annuum]|uniref:Uncharacterized protein n=1 Tax=Capsicum annuum TaxID=4072 RepID=A0A2G2YXP5_CAPAN|nr:hypothetical protein T459_21799 [Capsicum annuum]
MRPECGSISNQFTDALGDAIHHHPWQMIISLQWLRGLNSTLYNHFLVLLWRNGDQTYLNRTDMTADSEWETFQSQNHKQYNKSYPISGFSETSIDRQGLYSPVSSMGTSETAGNSLYTELVAETLDTLHTAYESLKLDNLRKCSSSVSHLPSLIFRDGSSVVNWGRKIVSFYCLLCSAELLGKRLSSGVSFVVASGSYNTPEELTVLSMVGERVGLQQLDLLPAGVSLPLRDISEELKEVYIQFLI